MSTGFTLDGFPGMGAWAGYALGSESENFSGETELAARIASYELAARMQLSVPEVTDLSSEPASLRKLYGDDA